MGKPTKRNGLLSGQAKYCDVNKAYTPSLIQICHDVAGLFRARFDLPLHRTGPEDEPTMVQPSTAPRRLTEPQWKGGYNLRCCSHAIRLPRITISSSVATSRSFTHGKWLRCGERSAFVPSRPSLAIVIVNSDYAVTRSLAAEDGCSGRTHFHSQ